MRVVDAVLSLPDFCWQTLEEVLGYVEQLNDNASYNHISVVLSKLQRKGLIESKNAKRRVDRMGCTNIKMWKRVSSCTQKPKEVAIRSMRVLRKAVVAEWPFGDIMSNHYGAILADPPWSFETWSDKGEDRAPDYDTQSMEWLQSLPVADLAAENCVLFMWVCWPTLPEALEVIKAWGFEYKTCGFAWMKADVSTIDMFSEPKDAYMGLGYWTRANSEACLLATRGKPKRLSAGVRQGIIAPRREHSRKPDGVHERIERLVAGPYCELFGRQKRAGWDVWGNQTEKFREIA